MRPLSKLFCFASVKPLTRVVSLGLSFLSLGLSPLAHADQLAGEFTDDPAAFLKTFYRKCFLGHKSFYENFTQRLEPSYINRLDTDLLDCLQLADKGRILISRDETLQQLGLDSRRAAKKVIRELESLRNNLAHAQDIVTYDWAQIARMAQRMAGYVGET